MTVMFAMELSTFIILVDLFSLVTKSSAREVTCMYLVQINRVSKPLYFYFIYRSKLYSSICVKSSDWWRIPKALTSPADLFAFVHLNIQYHCFFCRFNPQSHLSPLLSSTLSLKCNTNTRLFAHTPTLTLKCNTDTPPRTNTHPHPNTLTH